MIKTIEKKLTELNKNLESAIWGAKGELDNLKRIDKNIEDQEDADMLQQDVERHVACLEKEYNKLLVEHQNLEKLIFDIDFNKHFDKEII